MIRTVVISLLITALIISQILQVVIDTYQGSLLEEIIKFLIIMFFIRALRDSWKRIIIVVTKSAAIMAMIIAYMVFASMLGYTIFKSKKYVDPEGYFVTLPDTMFNVYVLFTTSNFPDILFPFWKVNNASALYFILFLLVGLYMLLNLLLAVFYNNYKLQVEKKINLHQSMRETFLAEEFAKARLYPETPGSEEMTLGVAQTSVLHIDQFKNAYEGVLANGGPAKDLVRAIEQENNLGISKGELDFKAYSILYMNLDFTKKDVASAQIDDFVRNSEKKVEKVNAGLNDSFEMECSLQDLELEAD